MPFFEASSRTTLVTATAGAVLAGFHAGSAPCRIREIHLFYVTAPTTSGALGLVRSTVLGTGALTGVAGIPRNPFDPVALGSVFTNFGTALPTTGGVGTTLRRFAAGPAIGNGIIWTFYEQEGLYVPANPAVNSEVALINLQATAPGTLDITVVWQE